MPTKTGTPTRSSLTPQTLSGAASCRNACPPSWWSLRRVRWRAGSCAGLLRTFCLVRRARRRRGNATVCSCVLTLHNRRLYALSPLLWCFNVLVLPSRPWCMHHSTWKLPVLFNPGLA